MIRVVLGVLADQTTEGVLRPVRSDFAPVSAQARDLGQRAGEKVEDRLRGLGPVPVGGAVLTPAGALPSSFLIHAVVMSEDEPQTSASVERALRNGLARATDWEVASLALPALGLGAGSMEPETAARGFLAVLREHLAAGRPPHEFTVVASSEYERALLEGLLASPTSG